MAIQVKSEIGRLRKVILHRPDIELEHLVPDDLERLLFEDIPYLKTAREEHDLFAGILRREGVEVLYLEDMAAEVLGQSREIKQQFITQFVEEGNVTDPRTRDRLVAFLMEIPREKELIVKLMSGVKENELAACSRGPLVSLMGTQSRFLLDPIPNLYFTRDPFACIGNGVSLNRMHSPTRRRETIFGQYIIKYHPEFAGVTSYYDRKNPFSIEGGDILNLSPKVLAIGISQRTTAEAIELLAKNIFADEKGQIETILALDIPSVRAFMHLDTVFSQVDSDKFVIHPGILRPLRTFVIKRGRTAEDLIVRESDQPIKKLLASCLELDEVSLIRCGGMDWIASEREQWNDGSNTLCIEPGKVIAYDRNYVTNQILRENGIEVLEMKSSELSRGRGGPRCMSMPIYRDK
ncbi:MAG: arginine deiminase [Eubacterium sp.]|nr:arginine deiminase [Eubacterium sp.]